MILNSHQTVCNGLAGLTKGINYFPAGLMDLLELIVVCHRISPCLCLFSQVPASVHEYLLSSLTRNSVCRKRAHPLPACDAAVCPLLTFDFPFFLVLADQCKTQTMRPSSGPEAEKVP